MKLSSFAFAFLCFVCLTSFGCAGGNNNNNNANNNSNAPDKDYATTQMSANKTYEVSYGELKKNTGESLEKILHNVYFSTVITIKKAGDASATIEKMPKVDADMPEHKHGMNVQPQVKSLGNNKFLVEGMLFHMPGLWVLNVDVVTDDQTTERATFNVWIE